MFRLKTLNFVLLTLALAIVVNLALSAETFAKDKRGHRRSRVSDRKAEKFINGHDARDGRFDGRGPRFRGDHRRGDHDWRDDDRRWRDDDRRRMPRRRRF